jgi:hypothetical protein
VHISNLDVFLMSMPKFSPEATVIVLSDPGELAYAQKMRDIFPIKAILPFTVAEQELEALLSD